MAAGQSIDDFADVSAWSPVASGRAELIITRDSGSTGSAMRLDFDFKGGGGFVVARKDLQLALPESYAFSFGLRGSAPPNKLEIKLIDPSGRNVWWYHEDAFEFPADWQRLRIRSSVIEFAWGPAGGGPMSQLGAVEIAIAAGTGGRGTVWIEDLRFEDTSFRSTPVVRASSSAPGHPPHLAVDRSLDTAWLSQPSEGPQWLALDFGEPRELGGLVVEWDSKAAPATFAVQTSLHANAWTTVYEANGAAGRRSYVYLPDTTAQHLRLYLPPTGSRRSFGVVDIDVRPHDFSRSINAFFENVARSERRGWYPRYLYGEQSFWTPVGVAGGAAPALVNQEGQVEVDLGSFSLEPFLCTDGELITWADAEVTQELVDGYLPIPSSVWRKDELLLRVTVFADGEPGPPAVWVRYRIEDVGSRARRLRLVVAVRPFQVTPPWQAFRGLGGVSPIHELSCTSDGAWVNGTKVVVPLTATSQVAAASFEQGAIAEFLTLGEVPPTAHIRDPFGYAAAALCFDLDLAAGEAEEVYVAVPFDSQAPAMHQLAELRSVEGAQRLAAVTRHWQRKLGKPEIVVPATARRCIDAVRTATAHILINRDGVALQPGPRRYTRSWIRDAATMSAALVRMDCFDEVRDFLRWYVRFQRADGNVPCCVDRSGPDWLAEHDSHGQLIFIVAEYFRFSGDRGFVGEMWSAVLAAADYLEALRRTRLTAEYATPGKRACYGLLPESVSHEGYLAHPVHAYWDDFWALRGLGDAAFLADVLGERAHGQRLARLRDSFRETLYDSIAATMSGRNLSYIPGSVEWADFDPTATATAIATTDAADRLPSAALAHTYDEYLAGLRKRRRGEIDWNNYTAYEIRNVGALVRLGRRDDANELLDSLLDDRRPAAWNQWPEITWREPSSPGHIGDVPHAWIGAEYVLAVLSLFAYERETDQALVVAAGIPREWIEGEAGVAVRDLPTRYGCVSFTLQRDASGGRVLDLHGPLIVPPGKIVLRPPLEQPLRRVEVNGSVVTHFQAHEIIIDSVPASVVMR